MCEHGTKTTPIFLPADGEASWSLLPSSISLLSGRTVQPENTYSRIFKVTGQVWESQKRISINNNHSFHQRSSPYTSLSWSNNKAWFSFNQPNRKIWVTKLVDVKYLPHKAFLSDTITGMITKANEALSSHEVTLALLDTNPVFQCLGIIIWLVDWWCNVYLLDEVIPGFCYSDFDIGNQWIWTHVDYHPGITSEPTNQVR